jgi:cation:H+ antiporter
VLLPVAAGLGWLLGLSAALWCAERLVHALDRLGHRVHLSAALLGTLVAFGADGPEVTSALIALTSGSQDVGAGVLIGSNIYNLAGLLGLSAILAGPLLIGPRRLAPEEGLNLLLTAVATLLILLVSLHVPLALVALVLFAGYLVRIGHPIRTRDRGEDVAAAPSPAWLASNIAISVLGIVAGSELLVRSSLYLAPRLHIPATVVGTVVLAIATSLPNTWAAVSLARRGQASAAVVATFSSNSINLVVGFAVPALFIAPHLPSVARFDVFWLGGMTVAAVALLAARHALTRREGMLLAGLYAAFLLVRLALLG